jgi:ABC-2 type transport system ATP-binding protein
MPARRHGGRVDQDGRVLFSGQPPATWWSPASGGESPAPRRLRVACRPGGWQDARVADAPALLELEDVRKSYGNVRALAGVTARISGQVIGLLGPNGAGKSTLLKCLLGLTPHEGRAGVLGLSSATDSFRIRDRVGYMPEMDSYLADLTAVELCSYAGELSGLPRTEAMQRAHAALYYAGLEEKRYLKVEGYSTGMKQRVKLAQALVHDPELLFLDEPTNGLDPRARDEMLELILELPDRRGCAIILSTHLLPDVDRVCDQVVIMHQGQLRFSGTIEELRRGGPVDQAVVPSVYDIEVKIGSEEAELAAALTRAGCTVEPRPSRRLVVVLPDGAGAALLFREARATGAQIRHLEPNQASLEEAFLRVVGAAPQADAGPTGVSPNAGATVPAQPDHWGGPEPRGDA